MLIQVEWLALYRVLVSTNTAVSDMKGVFTMTRDQMIGLGHHTTVHLTKSHLATG